MRGDGPGCSFESRTRSRSPISARIAALWSALRFRAFRMKSTSQVVAAQRKYAGAGESFRPESTKVNLRGPYFGGCSSPFNQPVALPDFSGSGRSHSKHWNVRCPLPPGGSARINNSPQWGQVGRLARPITISFRLSENPSIPEEDQSPESTR